jgi:hypothetical protein
VVFRAEAVDPTREVASKRAATNERMIAAMDSGGGGEAHKFCRCT